MQDVRYITCPAVTNDQLNELFSAAWTRHVGRDFRNVLGRSLAYVCAFAGDRLIGFVNVAWDEGEGAAQSIFGERSLRKKSVPKAKR